MQYLLWVHDGAKPELRRLPGNVRQRVQKTVHSLSVEPRPRSSIELTLTVPIQLEIRRIRLDDWRIIYVIDETLSEVGILAVRQRPPYNYHDLPELLAGLD